MSAATARVARLPVLLVQPEAIGAYAVIGAWALAAGVVQARTSYLPSLVELVTAFAGRIADGSLPLALLVSLGNMLLGFAIASAAGIVAGILLGLSPTLYRVVLPVLNFARSIPGIALLPVAILLAGIGGQAVSLVVSYASLWFVLLNVAQGVAGIHPITRETADILEVRGVRRLLQVYVPSALPQVFTGLRLSLGLALVAAISAELAVGGGGVGAFVARAQNGLRPDDAFAGIVAVAVTGWALLKAMELLEARVVPWAGRQ